MGALHHFNVRHLARQHGCRWFIETGTAHGDGIAHAHGLGCFERLDSIEAHPATAEAAKARFADCPDIHIHAGDSPETLRALLSQSQSLKVSQSCFFWLDAHFPGADVGHAAYDAEPDPAKRWPLQGELDAIASVPEIAASAVILIDDLRIYTGMAWAWERCVRAPDLDLTAPVQPSANPDTLKPYLGRDPSLTPTPLNLSAFAATHHAEVWHWHEGYVLLVPNA